MESGEQPPRKSYTGEIESHTQRKRNYIDLYQERERERESL